MEFKECKKSIDFLNFFENDELFKHHTNYYHYTSLENIDNILKGKCIYLTPNNGEKNDIAEGKNKSMLSYFACFSTGTSESLPLWYLYSGIDGKGGRIGLKRKSFRKLMNNPTMYLAKVEKGARPYKILEKSMLQKNDYDFVGRDILYMGKDTNNPELYRAKYNGNVVNKISEQTYREIKNEYLSFIKSLIWFYEKETRIQVNIKNQALVDENEEYVVMLDISNVINELSVRLAPEFEDLTLENISNYDGIKKWILSKIEKSDFAGEIKMNLANRLCNTCEHKKQSKTNREK